MSDSEGWVKLWRKSRTSGLLQNHELWAFWSWCLMKATHKPIKQMVGWQVVYLDPGQFIFGRKKAAEEVNLTERKIRTCLKKLENLGNLTIRTTNKYSVVSIVNWGKYQGSDQKSDQQDDQRVTSRRPAGDHKQECKNVRSNKKNNIVENKPSRPSPPYKKIIDYLNKKAGTSFKETTKATKGFIKARLNEGFTEEDFYTVIDNKTAEWLTDEKMVKFLRPQTLFQASKFEAYLQQAPGKPTSCHLGFDDIDYSKGINEDGSF